MNVSQKIGNWFDSNKRFLPWRETCNPYFIWLSEIILQQTRVNQGFAYYQRFIERYPKLANLAAASIEDVLLLWQGLGYYSRARNLHKTAQMLVEKFNGRFPEEYEQLLKFPGIGEYTAGAIASLAFNKPVISIDGNVHRVLARYFGIGSDISTAAGKADFRQAAAEILDTFNPGRHNQAMIELGALICLPSTPNCAECPIIEGCYAFNMKQVAGFPLRTRKAKPVSRYFFYLIFNKKNKIFLRQRGTDDIWALLFDFPVIEMKEHMGLKKLLKTEKWKALSGSSDYNVIALSKSYRHVLSHQVLHVRFIELKVDESFRMPGAVEIDIDQISHYPVPRLIDIYLTDRSIKHIRV